MPCGLLLLSGALPCGFRLYERLCASPPSVHSKTQEGRLNQELHNEPPYQVQTRLDGSPSVTPATSPHGRAWFLPRTRSPFQGDGTQDAVKKRARAPASGFGARHEVCATRGWLLPTQNRAPVAETDSGTLDRHPAAADARLYTLSFQPGTPIFREGDPGDSAYVIERGRVEISTQVRKKKKVLGSLGPGQVFGEMAVIDNAVRSATGTAVEETQLTVIAREQLQTRNDAAEPILRLLLKAWSAFAMSGCSSAVTAEAPVATGGLSTPPSLPRTTSGGD
jgi:hypothetical protein